MLEEFRNRRGYDPKPYLAAMAGEIVENTDITERFLNDVRRTIADCVADGHYKIWADRAHEKGVQVRAEAGGQHLPRLMMNDGYYNAGGIPYIPLPGGCGFDSAMSFGIIRSGRMAATVLGALQVSVEGDLANWASQGRAFGMGGAMDLCNGARQVIVAMELTTKDGKPKIVNRCTFPLTAAGCVNHIVTERCVIDVTTDGLVLSELRKNCTISEIQSAVEPTLMISPVLKEMEEN